MVPASAEAATAAAEIIRLGGLVVIPTETVYGLAADALNPGAVARIYEAKGRPAHNPLIVHVAEPQALEDIADTSHPTFKKLTSRFWPGPLTLVLPKKPSVPDITTGGLDTVAVRVPANATVRDLIRLAGPIAAPSANRFTEVSPTRVEHLNPLLLEHVDLVIDAGPCEVGVESTVLDLTGEEPCILRPGGAAREEIEVVLGRPATMGSGSQIGRSPGTHPRHYAPRTRLRLVRNISPNAAGLTFDDPRNEMQIKMASEANAYAAQLYDSLHRLDRLGVPEVEVELPPDTPEWSTVLDRLKRASTQ